MSHNGGNPPTDSSSAHPYHLGGETPRGVFLRLKNHTRIVHIGQSEHADSRTTCYMCNTRMQYVCYHRVNLCHNYYVYSTYVYVHPIRVYMCSPSSLHWREEPSAARRDPWAIGVQRDLGAAVHSVLCMAARIKPHRPIQMAQALTITSIAVSRHDLSHQLVILKRL